MRSPKFDAITDEDRPFTFTLTEFILGCADGRFNSSRGFGELATADQKAWNHRVMPENVDVHLRRDGFPFWATHVVWYGQ